MSKSHCFFPSRKDDERRRKAVDVAKRRGDAATEWFKTNKLTPETKPEFDKLMKSVSKTESK